ncbi:hypothetical protein QJS04_geneDACA021606 [Acorus gramineus]|uniref:Factor of DNA methylation 1-5/IDN2 domain-containing protein n=1 Tax=Acorus gramineus TaxID=55184 RepID=A0AAV9B692_ACOGR|nr:hypothetical protein QJS04_geneDACA021606 [Acorus gramineus]
MSTQKGSDFGGKLINNLVYEVDISKKQLRELEFKFNEAITSLNRMREEKEKMSQSFNEEMQKMKLIFEENQKFKSDLDEKLAKECERSKEELKEKMEEMEDLEAINKTLTIKERMTNDELQEAHKELVQLDIMNLNSRTSIGIKRMGEIDQKAFLIACNQRYAEPADLKAAELCSKWQEEIKNSQWQPHKIVIVADKPEV